MAALECEVDVLGDKYTNCIITSARWCWVGGCCIAAAVPIDHIMSCAHKVSRFSAGMPPHK